MFTVIRKNVLYLLIVSLFLVLVVPNKGADAETTHPWKQYKNAEEYMKKGKYKEAIRELEASIKQSRQASSLRLLAEVYELDGQIQKAADTYYEEAELHRLLGEKSGDMNTYFAVLAMADALNTEIEIFIQDNIAIQSTTKLAKFEPENGMYIGAFVEKDSGVENKKNLRFEEFNKLTGKQHAVFFTYHKYGADFNSTWTSYVKDAGGAIHLALQPEQGLAMVKDDATLRKFARDAQAAGVPIFLRFAGEMNGNWVKWYGNPELYIEKFRLVAKVMKEEAPNVAMVWSPAANPKRNIHDYYPGDDYVDWIGLSLYSVKYFNGDVKSPADQVNPLDSLDYVYQAYADRKPIMISEFGATHYSKAGNTDATNFSITKMNMLYHGAKLKYPRLKGINWFSINTLTDSHNAERTLNNFSLTENTTVLNAYKQMIKDPYYLGSVVGFDTKADAATLNQSVTALQDQAVHGKVTGIAWVKTYDPYISKVVFAIDGKQVALRLQYPYDFPIDTTTLSVGNHKLQVTVYDSKGREASNKTVTFKVGKPVGELADDQVKMYINEKYVYTKSNKLELTVAPFVSDNRTLVPLRFISEVLGASVIWNNKAKTITIKADSTIILTVGSSKALVDGKSLTLDVPPDTIQGTTFVPLRFVNEMLGGKISLNSKEGSITLTKKSK